MPEKFLQQTDKSQEYRITRIHEAPCQQTDQPEEHTYT